MDREQFRLDRVRVMEETGERLEAPVQDYLDGTLSEDDLYLAIETEFVRVWETDFGLTDNWRDAWDWFKPLIQPGIDAITDNSVARTISDWLGTATVNGARIARTTNDRVWLSRRDDRVRATHREADGQIVSDQEPFTVCGGVEVMFPGQPVGPPECWINCRCVAAPASIVASAFAEHDLIWYENRRTPEVVPKGGKGKKGGAGTAAGPVIKRRAATKEEERKIRNGGWLRVEPGGKTPSDPGYKDAKKSKVRPQNNSLEDDMPDITADDVAAFAGPEDELLDPDELLDEDLLDDDAWEDDGELGGGMEDGEFDNDPIPDMIPWYGVLAPEGVRSGDGRKFSPGALTHRPLPMPFRWQETDIGGHDGAVTIGTIDNIWREGDLYMGSGLLLDSETADRFVGQVMDGAARGISVDVDEAELAADSADGEVEFAKGRVSAATAVAIPAFAEAYLALGEWMGDMGGEIITSDTTYNAEDEFKDYDAEARKRAAEKGNALPDGSYPINDCEDLKNAIQAIGRASDPDKVKAHIRKRKRELGCPEVELPDTWGITDLVATALTRAAGEATYVVDTTDVLAPRTFKRGPGWVTNPTETRRLHHYWTKGAGAKKIRWGTPGDFRRLRRALAKYINPIYLNRTAAQWHKDALGYWPGECGKPGNPPCGSRTASADGESVHLVATASPTLLDYDNFTDPQFDALTPVTIEGDRIFGHIAPWDQCHIGISGVCTTAPHSATNYAYFRTGAVQTTNGLVPVGNITLDTGHASLSENARGTVAHYDNTGTIVADIAAGEDEFGIWFSGELRDGVTHAMRRQVLAVGISGDWRSIGGNLELVAALCVPVPGFPIKRPQLAASGGVQTALQLPPVEPVATLQQDAVDLDALAAALEARQEKRTKIEEAAAEVRNQRIEIINAMMCDEPGCRKGEES